MILPDWLEILIIKVGKTGGARHLSKRVKSKLYKAYIDGLSRELHRELTLRAFPVTRWDKWTI